MSWVDSIIMMWLCAPSGVSKDANADIPLIGTCIKGYQNIYVPSKRKGRATQFDGAPRQNIAKVIVDRWVGGICKHVHQHRALGSIEIVLYRKEQQRR